MSRDAGADGTGERPETHVVVIELEPEHRGGTTRAGDHLGVVGLREQDQPPVVPEVLVAQLGMAVEAEPGDDERVEVLGEVVGQVEGPRLGVGERRERRAPAKTS